MKNVLKKSLLVAVMCAIGVSAIAQTYTKRTVSTDGKTSTWTLDAVTGGDKKLTADPVTDNDIIFAPSAKDKIKFASSGYMSCNGGSSIYLPVPSAAAAGKVSQNPSSSSDSRYFQLYINGKEGSSSQRLWSKAMQKESDDPAKRGPQEFDFTSSDLTQKDGKYYLHFKDNNTEMKISSFSITLTSGTYSGGSEPVTVVNVTGVKLNKSSVTLEEGKSETLTATVEPTDATDKSVTWKSSDEKVAKVDNNGKVTAIGAGSTTITVTTTDGGKTATCSVTVTAVANPVAVTGVKLDKIALTIEAGKSATLTATVEPGNATKQGVTWTSSNTKVATVDSNGKVTGVAEGSATIEVKTDDGGKTAFCAVMVTKSTTPVVPVPSTTLTIHEPDLYEVPGIDGGYGGKLAVSDGREYEVYYMTRDANSKFCIATTNADKTAGLTTLGSNDYSCTSNDGWFSFSGAAWSSSSDALGAEFGTMSRRLDMDNISEFTMHFIGYDQFALVARDKKKDTSSGGTKPADNRYLEVYIDGVLQPQQFNSTPSIRRYDVSPLEHVVRVIHIGTEKSAMYAFSLRVSQSPRVRHLIGNDSTQNILATRAMKEVKYIVKYNEKTELIWEGGKEATGVTLQTAGSDGVSDTLTLSGNPTCAAGTYNYRIVTYQNGSEASSVSGKLTVSTQIEALTDTIITGYTNEDIDEIRFRCYAGDSKEVSLTWKEGKAPAGISTGYKDNTFSISGTPTAQGTYEYTIGVNGGNTIQGKITILTIDLSNNPVMFIYKGKYEDDAVYAALKQNKHNLIPRLQKTAPRNKSQYDPYTFIVIAETTDADNAEVLDIINNVKKPVLNMKNFTYTTSRLGWGYPKNGAVGNTKVTVMQPAHPIFKGLNVKEGAELSVLETKEGEKGIMPTEITLQGSLCLATAPMRSDTNYYTEGAMQTAIHEVPASKRGAKYLLLPFSGTLNSNGKTLLQNAVSYLLSSEASVTLPELRLTSFSIDGKEATINESDLTIRLTLPEGTDLTALTPQMSVIGTATHTIPESGTTVDFSNTTFGTSIIVTDYINRKVYTAYVNTVTGLDNARMEGVNFDGETLHNLSGLPLRIYNAAGQLVGETDGDFRFGTLPGGIYLVQSAEGGMKIAR
ncbi:MAG: Ig domain-containing protein [Paludibacteraceae bacterium]|nr:Ig domain-containing protein [Paludibacteraceae bacterium]